MKILKFTIVFCLCILLINNIVLGSETEAPTPPVAPTELTEQNVNAYNQQVDEYNQQVDEYNQLQQEQYNQELTQYNESLIHNQEEDAKVQQVVQENLQEEERVRLINQQKDEEALLAQQQAIQHNEEQDQKVEENQKALEEQAKMDEAIQSFEEKGLSSSTADAAELPTDWSVTTTADDAKTIKVEEAEEPAEENYNIINIHFYLDGNESDTVENGGVTFDENDNLIFQQDLTNNFVLAEWETIETNKNDNVMTISESEPMGYRSAAFYRYMDGYTKGYWVPGYSTFMSNAVDSDSTWYKGVAQEFSYKDGTTDRQPIKNVFSLYTYSFYRTGNEPTRVEEYIPNYYDTNITVEYEQPVYKEYVPNYIIKNNPIAPTYLSTLGYLTYIPPAPAVVIPQDDIPEPIVEPEVIVPEEKPEPIIEPEVIIPEITPDPVIEPEPVVEPEIIVPEPIVEPEIIVPEIVPAEPITIPDDTTNWVEPIDININTITPNDVIINYPVVYPQQQNTFYPVAENVTNTTTGTIVNNTENSGTNEIEIEDSDVPLAANRQLYDFRGIPIQYSPGESGIYVGSNRGLKPTGGYLLKR